MGVFKFEARNPKIETNSNYLNSKFQTFLFRKLDYSNLGFVSNFDIRISNFRIS
jgi:hypothetical protein